MAVINHFGENIHIGHYNTIVLNAAEGCYEFDDRSVRKVSSSMISGKQAYLLFYELSEVILFCDFEIKHIFIDFLNGLFKRNIGGCTNARTRTSARTLR